MAANSIVLSSRNVLILWREWGTERGTAEESTLCSLAGLPERWGRVEAPRRFMALKFPGTFSQACTLSQYIAAIQS